jgi:hypothetical protein
MRKIEVVLAAGLLTVATPAFAQSVDSHYYRHHRHVNTSQIVTGVPPEATAEVLPQSSCHVVHATVNPYCPPDCQWTTACGPD